MATLPSHAKALRSNAQLPPLRAINRHAVLTKSQKAVALLILEGWSNEKIAQVLHIQKRTVESHVSNMLEVLGLKNRLEIAANLLENPNLIFNKRPKDSSEQHLESQIGALKEQRLKAALAISDLLNKVEDRKVRIALRAILEQLQPEDNLLKVYFGNCH